MSKLINVLTTVATLAMAAVPLSAIGTVAHAAEVRIQVADLDLSNPADAARFQDRVERAAHAFCRNVPEPLANQTACRSAVRDEAVQRLGSAQRESLKIATQGQGVWRVAGF
ncbi:MAG: UrcA family protein [Caulobacteraceae bacterium]